MGNVSIETYKESLFWSIAQSAVTIIFMVMVLFLPLFKAEYEYVPMSSKEFYEMSPSERNEFNAYGHVTKEMKFSMYDDFRTFTNVAKEEGGSEDFAMAMMDNLINICIVAVAFISIIMNGISLITKGIKFVMMLTGMSTAVPPMVLAVKNTALQSVIPLIVLTVIDVITANKFMELLGLHSVRYMSGFCGITVWAAILLVIVAIAVYYVGSMKLSCDMQMQTALTANLNDLTTNLTV